MNEDFNVTSDIVQRENGDDPFQDVDREFSNLIPQVVTNNACSIKEYIEGEINLSAHQELSEKNWEEEFLVTACASTADNNEEGDDDDNDEGNDNNDGDTDDVMEIEEEESMPKINTYREAIVALEDVQVFLENKGLTEEATSASLMVSTVAQLYCSSIVFNKLLLMITLMMCNNC